MTKETTTMISATTSNSTDRAIRLRTALLAALATVSLAWLIGAFNAGSAEAVVSIRTFDSYPSTTQAGGHPDFTITFENDNRFDPALPGPCGCNAPKDVIVNLPAGVIGNPHSAPRCDAQRFAFDECPMDSQIGVATPTGCLGASLCGSFPQPLYNLVPPPDQAGVVGFKTVIFNTPLFTVLTARTGSDYGLRATVQGIQNVLIVPKFIQQIWGVPADPSHDDLRYKVPPILIGGGDRGYPSNSPLTAFMTNPTTCGRDDLETTIEIIAYDHEHSTASAPWPATTGCGQLSFNPSLSAKPTTTEADSPSGVDVDLTVPQPQSPSTPSPSSIRGTTVKLPPGFSVNPNAADGKSSCTDAQAKFGTEDQAECPEYAKVGTLEIHSGVLPGVLPGAVYLGEPQPGNRYRLFLVADGFGLHVKLPGQALLDPDTGQITVSFQDLPQTPFEEFNLHFFGSERGLLATPEKCGTYPVVSTFTPWNDELADQTSTQFFQIDRGPGGSPCPGTTRPFGPTFKASSAGNTAGAYSPLEVRFGRDDGDQNLSAINVSTPTGFSGKLAGIPYCSEAALATASNPLYTGLTEIANPICGTASQIGTAVAAAGAGSRPLYQPGKVFLAGPYKGAPLSLVVVVPAVSGPFDLGNIVTRAAINVNPSTARVTTLTDPLPQIIEGIPLRVRSVAVKLDRPEFALNPTNCSKLSTDATLFGDEDGQAAISSHYQVANCAGLSFKPRLTLSLTGGVRRRGHPAIKAVLTAQPGEANLSSTSVALPKGELLDNSHIGTICTRPQFAADQCPEGSLLGTAEAVTPILDAPLKGNVYLRSSSHNLPDLVADLEGQIDIELAGTIDTINGGSLRTTFESVPDAPVRQFTLNLNGGKRGLLQNSKSLCGKPKYAVTKMIGQNGAQVNLRTPLRVSCGSARQKKKAKRAAISSGKGA
jgi:hypothetical protein